MLLNIICSSSSGFNRIIIKDKRKKGWLFSHFTEFSSSIKKKYNAKKLSVELKKTQGQYLNEVWVVISNSA